MSESIDFDQFASSIVRGEHGVEVPRHLFGHKTVFRPSDHAKGAGKAGDGKAPFRLATCDVGCPEANEDIAQRSGDTRSERFRGVRFPQT